MHVNFLTSTKSLRKKGAFVYSIDQNLSWHDAINRLYNLLLDTSNRLARADGWTLLSTANQQFEKSLTEDFALVKETFGKESLKELILESELFDLAISAEVVTS